ncbi:MAG: response regulator [Alkaliphilus sp.]
MKIVIIDDHPVVRHGLKQTLNIEDDMEVIGMANSSQQGIDLIIKESPDLAIVDLNMPGGGMDLIRQIREQSLDVKLVILTSYASQEEIKEALSLNVDGCVLKEILPEELVNAIRLVSKGRRYYDPNIMQIALSREKNDPLDQLTARELEVLKTLAGGLNNKAIAKKLFISESTVKKHISNILDKLELQDRTQAALYSFSRGFGENSVEEVLKKS